jgi:hypothetical protein
MSVGWATQLSNSPSARTMQGDNTQDAAEVRDPEALRLEYEYVRSENLRLRDGRAAITRQLGPLPISAAIVAGLVTGFTSKAHENAFLWLALLVFVVLVLVSIKYAGMKPYRVLRNDKEERFPRSTQSKVKWYENAIALEKKIYGESYERKGFQSRLPSADVANLQDGYDRERSGLFIVQALFAIVVVFLIISRVI